MTRWTAKPKTFTVRQRTGPYDIIYWQIGENVCGDQSYYLREYAIRCFDKLLKRKLAPVFEDGASDPRLV